MDEHELAALLSTHPPQPTSRRTLRSTTMARGSQSRNILPSEPISPRQQFQNTVRSISDETVRRHRRNRSINLRYNPYELHHVSSLRVEQRQPRLSVPTTRAAVNTLQQVTEEPDFVTEEREAWSRRSPSASLRAPFAQKRRQTVEEFTLYEDSSTDGSDEENDDRTDKPDLPPFAPLPTSIDTNHRPKTRRGTETDNTSLLSDVGSSRTPKFVEGSMTSRSGPVASTWSEYSSENETSASEADDSDATPKAGARRRSNSLDLKDFMPAPVSARTIKRTLFRRRQNTDTEDENPKPKKSKKQKEEKENKKKLRKSISGWNLHALGEKIGLFNSSSTSISDIEPTEASATTSEKNILDDRKRKAEETYAQRFGSKKHKSNDNVAHDSAAYMSEPDQPVTMRHRAGFDPNATIKARSGNISRRTSLGASVNERSGLSEHDTRKQKSMRQLEKENQQLRALLREQEAVQNATVTRRTGSTIKPPPTPDSSFEINPDDAPLVPVISSRRAPLGDIANTRALPPLPSASIDGPIKILSADHPILRPTPPSHNVDPHINTSQGETSALPRPVSMIIEEPEPEPEGEGPDVTEIKHERNASKPKKYVVKNAAARRRLSTTKIGQENVDIVHGLQDKKSSAVSEKSEAWKGWDDDVF